MFGREVAARQTGLREFARTQVVPLYDEQATKENIIAVLERLSGAGANSLPPAIASLLLKIGAAQPEDAVILYFSGHGTAQGQRFYLVPHDLGYKGGRDVLDEASLEKLLPHCISDTELEREFRSVDAGRILLVIDACNSGQALEAEEKRRGPMNSKGLAQLAYEKGMYILAAAQGYQAALEMAQFGHGLLTYALVEKGLVETEADRDSDGEIVIREWLDYATQKVPQLREGRSKQVTQAQRQRALSVSTSSQRPRVFYRRETELKPWIISKH